MEKEKNKIDWEKILRILIRVLTIGIYHIEKHKKQ